MEQFLGCSTACDRREIRVLSPSLGILWLVLPLPAEGTQEQHGLLQLIMSITGLLFQQSLKPASPLWQTIRMLTLPQRFQEKILLPDEGNRLISSAHFVQESFVASSLSLLLYLYCRGSDINQISVLAWNSSTGAIWRATCISQKTAMLSAWKCTF